MNLVVPAVEVYLAGCAPLVGLQMEAWCPWGARVHLVPAARALLPWLVDQLHLTWTSLDALTLTHLAEVLLQLASGPYLATALGGIVLQHLEMAHLGNSTEHKTVASAAWKQVGIPTRELLALAGPVASSEVAPSAVAGVGEAKGTWFVFDQDLKVVAFGFEFVEVWIVTGVASAAGFVADAV